MNKSLLNLDEVKILHQQGRLAEAKLSYLQLIKEDPNHIEALHWLGILCAEMGDLDDAQVYLELACSKDVGDVALQLHLANVLKAKRLYQEAAAVLQNVLRVQPDYAAAYNNLGTVYYAEARWQEAINAYQSAIQIQADYADAYYNLGLALAKMNRRNEAVHAFEALIALAPNHPGAHFQLGCLLMQMFNYKRAIVHFSIIEKQHPYHFETQTNLATCYLKLGKLAEANNFYHKALALIPDDVQVLFNLGIIAMQKGEPQAAVEYYSQALSLAPNFFAAHNNLGIAYMALQNPEAALQQFHAALAIEPENTAIKHTINIINGEKSLSSSPAEYIRSLFDSYADHYDSHLTQTLGYQIPQLFHAAVKKCVPVGSAHWDILDLGCGTGLCGEVFKADARTLVGVDLSEKMLEIAAQKNSYDQLIQADILDFLVAKKQAYDLIIAGDVLVYFGDLTALFAAVSQALRPDAYIVFNAELSHGEDYLMTASGRFAHGKSYLDQLVSKHHLQIVLYEVAGMRIQNQQPVSGHLYVLKKLT